MFFHLDDDGGVIQTAVKNLFHPFKDNYRVIISNIMQFRLVVAQIARGISIRQVVGIISDMKNIRGMGQGIGINFSMLKALGMAQLEFLNNTMITNYVRIVLGQNLQLLSNILSIKNQSSWAFLIANDASMSANRLVTVFRNRIDDRAMAMATFDESVCLRNLTEPSSPSPSGHPAR